MGENVGLTKKVWSFAKAKLQAKMRNILAGSG